MDRLLTLKEACEVMHVSYSKGQQLAKSGQLPFIKLGGTWAIAQSVLFGKLELKGGVSNEEKDGSCADA